MEGFLERTGYAEDQILVSFASLVGDAFFTEGKDVLVSDESPEYRAPLIAALTEKYLRDAPAPEAGQGTASLPARVLLLVEHRDVLSSIQKLYADEGLDCAVVESASDLSGLDAAARGARIVAIHADAFLSAAEDARCKPREFTFIAIEGADTLSELPTEIQRKIWGHLVPPWDRRALLLATHVGIRTKNLAIDFANNPTTVVLKKAQASLNAIETSMFRVASDRKFGVLLWLIRERARQGDRAVAVFCNLRQTSREVEARLKLNSISAEHISSAAPKQINSAIFARFAALRDNATGGATSAEGAAGAESGSDAGAGPLVLCISNDNLEALPSELALVGIHFDIPLDADVYLERVRVMRTKGASMIGLACERYEVGLSAITSRFGTKFELLEVSAEMLASPDSSEGVPLDLERPRRDDDRGSSSSRRDHADRRDSFDRRDRRDRRDDASSEQRGPRPNLGAQSRGPRDQNSRDQGFRDQRPRDGQGRRRRNEPRRSETHPLREGGDAALYSMSTEERLAFFRNKYKDILKSPAPGQGEKTKNKRSAPPFARGAQKPPEPSGAPETPSTPAAPSAPAPRAPGAHPASAENPTPPQSSGAQESGGIVKRFIDKLFSGDRDSGAGS